MLIGLRVCVGVRVRVRVCVCVCVCVCVAAAADLTHLRERNVEALSGGELQRFACAVVCIQQADMYVLRPPPSSPPLCGGDVLC